MNQQQFDNIFFEMINMGANAQMRAIIRTVIAKTLSATVRHPVLAKRLCEGLPDKFLNHEDYKQKTEKNGK